MLAINVFLKTGTADSFEMLTIVYQITLIKFSENIYLSMSTIFHSVHMGNEA